MKAFYENIRIFHQQWHNYFEHTIIFLEKIKNNEERIWYVEEYLKKDDLKLFLHIKIELDIYIVE